MSRTRLLAFVVLLIGTFVVVYNLIFQKAGAPSDELDIEPQPTPNVVAELQDKVGKELPAAGQKITLEDKSETSLSAAASRDYSNGVYSLTLIADLPDGNYSASLIDPTSGQTVNLGHLTNTKGGYLLDFSSGNDLMNYTSVQIVSHENTSTMLVMDGAF